MLCMWGYLFVYGAPEKTLDVFSNLGVLKGEGTDVRTVNDGIMREGDSQLSLQGGELEQLTTRAIAGFAYVPNSTYVRYVERGTGHIYEIDLSGGMERQISLTTVPKTTEAVFSPDTETVVLTSYEGETKKVSVGKIRTEKSALDVTELTSNAENISFRDNTDIYFSKTQSDQTIGYAFNSDTNGQEIVFQIPLTDVTLEWGNGLEKFYVFPKAAKDLEGALYVIEKNTLKPVSKAAPGFTAMVGDSYFVTSYIKNNRFIAESIHGNLTTQHGVPMFKEKCVFDTTADGVWCGAPLDSTSPDYLSSWYKGSITSEDYIWYTDLTGDKSTLVGYLPKLSGRILDVYGMALQENGASLLFSNKIDQTLWIYRIKQ